MAPPASWSKRRCGSAPRHLPECGPRATRMRAPILFSAAPERGHAFAQRWAGQQPAFCCVLAHTDTCLIPGVSAAGISEELRPYTPAADAEVVHLGAPRCISRLPSNP